MPVQKLAPSRVLGGAHDHPHRLPRRAAGCPNLARTRGYSHSYPLPIPPLTRHVSRHPACLISPRYRPQLKEYFSCIAATVIQLPRRTYAIRYLFLNQSAKELNHAQRQSQR